MLQQGLDTLYRSLKLIVYSTDQFRTIRLDTLLVSLKFPK